MVFQVPPSKASIKQNRFEFQVPGSRKTWSLPHMQYLNADLSQRLGSATARILSAQKAGDEPDPLDGVEIAELQRSIIDTYCPGLYAEVDQEQLQAIVEAWQAASKVSLGESTASAES